MFRDEIPEIKGTQMIPDVKRWIAFRSERTRNPARTGLMFYVDDERLECLWRNPERYAALFSSLGAVLSPDFSLYADRPTIEQQWNHYRKHVVGNLWQHLGLTVIPTVGWSDEKSFDWCFTGEPTNSVISVSSVGTQRYAKTEFLRGYDAMMERLNPSAILFVGNTPKECRGNIIPIEPFYKSIERRRKLRAEEGQALE